MRAARAHLVLAGVLLASGACRRAAPPAPALPPLAAGPLPPRTIVFTDHRKDELVDPVTGLIRFADWARSLASTRET